MMQEEHSANLHHHLLTDASSSSSSYSSSTSSSSSYAAAGARTDRASWPQSSPFTTGVGLLNPINHKSDTSDHHQDHLNFLHSSWNPPPTAAHPQQFPKLSSSSPSTIEEFHSPLHLPNYNPIRRIDQKEDDDLLSSTRVLLQSISSSSGQQIFPSRDDGFYPRSGGAFSQIYPSINISNLITYSSPSSATSSSSILGASSYQDSYMDLLTLSSNTSTDHHLDHNLSFGGLHDHHDSMQQYCYSSPTTQTSSTSANEVADAKPTSTQQQPAPNKKSRSEPRASSCPPFKVRKEKLGDRIAALQQLVAPFGKTDTASVLMEAIGYINFLQNQVQTLSVPYMKSSSHNKSNRTTQKGVVVADRGNGEAKGDLRSRGLCLVPLSCMSYVASDDGGGGGGAWPPPPTHGGRT